MAASILGLGLFSLAGALCSTAKHPACKLAAIQNPFGLVAGSIWWLVFIGADINWEQPYT